MSQQTVKVMFFDLTEENAVRKADAAVRLSLADIYVVQADREANFPLPAEIKAYVCVSASFDLASRMPSLSSPNEAGEYCTYVFSGTREEFLASLERAGFVWEEVVPQAASVRIMTSNPRSAAAA